MAGPTVRVGIVSWNTADLLDRCLTALPAALDGLDATVVVVDNASSDGSAAVVERHEGVTLVRNGDNRGYAVAMNQALGGAGADVLVALNPDAVAPPGSLRTLVERLLADPTVGVVGPRLADDDGSLQHSAYRFPSLRLAAVAAVVPPFVLRRGLGARWWIEGYAPHDRPADVDWLVGAVHVLRAAAVDRAAPYRERWFLYAEDLDLCWRLAGGGWRRRLEADVVVTHTGNASGEQRWGAERVDRILGATHSWYVEQHGSTAGRAWAAVQSVGLALRLVVWWPGRHRSGRDLGHLARQLRVLSRAVMAGRA